MKTRRARTAARSDIASTTAPRSRTTRRTSSAASAATPATWLVIARIGSGVRAGATTGQWVPGRAVASVAAATPWIASTRYVHRPSPSTSGFRANTCHSNSCKNSVALAPLPHASKPALDPRVRATGTLAAAAAMLGPGLAVPPAALLLGVLGTTAITMAAIPAVLPAVLPAALPADPRAAPRPGLVTVATAAAIVAATAIGTVVTAAPMAVMEATTTTRVVAITRMAVAVRPRPQAPLLGISPWPLRADMVDTQAMAVTAPLVLLLAWAVRLLACLPRPPAVRRLVSLAGSTRSSSSMPMRRRPLRLRLGMLRRRRLPWTCRLRRRVLSVDSSGLTCSGAFCIGQWKCY